MSVIIIYRAFVVPVGRRELFCVADSVFLFCQLSEELLNVIELRLNLPESRELDFELPADVAELLFNSCEDDGSGWRRSFGAAFSASPLFSPLSAVSLFATLPTLAPFAAVAVDSLLAPFSALAVGAFRAPQADGL